MNWVVYVTWEPSTGRHYVGKSSAERVEAGYQGSGVWVTAAKAKGRKLLTQVLLILDAEIEAYEAEGFCVPFFLNDPRCMNMTTGGCGVDSEFAAANLSRINHKRWADPDYRARAVEGIRARCKDPLHVAKTSAGMRAWQRTTPGQNHMRKAAAKARSQVWSNPETAAKLRAHLARLAERNRERTAQ